jgi:V/A-type H+-transporting ATPase subunit F
MSTANLNRAMAALGDYESVLPFQAVGIEPHVLEEGAEGEARETLNKLVQRKYAVVFIVEEWYERMRELIEEINEKEETSIVPIPGLRGSKGLGFKSIKSSVERAVGMDIFSVK